MLSRRPTSRLPPPAQVNAELRLETVRHACTAVLRECDREYPELAGHVRAHFANIRPRLVASLQTQVAALDEAGNGPAAAKLARAAQDFAAEVTSGRGEGGGSAVPHSPRALRAPSSGLKTCVRPDKRRWRRRRGGLFQCCHFFKCTGCGPQ